MDDYYVVQAPFSTLLRRWSAAAPSWANDVEEILRSNGRDGYHCPVTGAHVVCYRHGFMRLVTIRGYGDKTDARRCHDILTGAA